jgi:peptidoglycan/xylan/chitin deacetylase (PgdA/CDA1 family)
MSALRTSLAVGGLGAAAAHWGPAAVAVAPLRRRLLPAMAGLSDREHVALTFDDGPDQASTPQFLELLARYDVHATFFVLGAHLDAHRDLVRAMVAGGHELAVHGWDHQCLAWKRPGTIRDELARTVDLVSGIGGEAPTWYRPPYGVATGEALAAARAVGLRTVLWSAWGRDWERSATPETVALRVDRALRPGGTVLLHDTDRTSAPGSWRTTLAATQLLLEDWRASGTDVGPLRDHA